jgi:cobalamin-dependent methionine synthase I
LAAPVRYLTLAQAQAKAFVVDWKDPINKPIKPSFIGTKAFKSFPIQDVVEYIDWNPFFQVGCKCQCTESEQHRLPPCLAMLLV